MRPAGACFLLVLSILGSAGPALGQVSDIEGDVIADVVQVLDSFDLALHHEMPPDVEKGIILIRAQLEDALRRRGLEVIHAKGQMFDPAIHESVGEVASDAPEGTVIEELQKGYRLAGKVIRPARVKIATHKA